MLSATWNWLWEKHDQAKALLRFFVKPNDADIVKEKEKTIHKIENNVDNNGDSEKPKRAYNIGQLIGLFLGPLAFIFVYFFFKPADLSQEGLAVLASTVWIAIWWITEALPIPVTSLMPFILFPITGGMDVNATASSYGSETIFLFMGGFMIALAIEKWNLHRRIALGIIKLIGTNTNRIVLGFMVATGFLSMWISNTAAAMMMVPMALAITYQLADALKNDPTVDTSPENFGFGKALMLSIAYSASLGGIATLIGTPPNALLAGAVKELYGVEISFFQWMLIGVPFAWLLLFAAWLYLVKIAYPTKIKEFPGGKAVIEEELRKLGKTSYEEKAVLVIFSLTALAWILRSFVIQKYIPGIQDGIIAIIGAALLFVIPAKNKEGDRLLDWNTAVKLPWGILLLFGGGLAIAAGFSSSGLSQWVGQRLSVLEGVNIILMILAVSILVNILTEVTSNTATASMMIPIIAGLALALNVHPYALLLGSTISASTAFMLPVATPPNAVVFGSGYLRIPDMVKAGFIVNIFSVMLLVLMIYFLVPLVWGIDLSVFPEAFK